ncbi:MAG: glutamate 5-kinase [Tatlockia sp.]|nr:glutamate 5-kinase [Tatlockia sp.]
MKIVIKVGTQSILSAEGVPFESIMLHLVEQLISLKKAGHQLVLVSSGAVASGRKAASQFGRKYGNSIGEKQVLASLGQHELISLYASMFRTHKMLASQLLLTKQDFQTRQHYLNISRLLHEILGDENIIPIINENDSVAIEELMFTDNDELAGLIAAQINADKLIILSNVEGVYTGHPDEPDSKFIPLIDPKQHSWPEISTLKSLHGRGGMISKLATARKMSNLGICTHIASIEHKEVINRLVNNESLGTTVLPSARKSNLKRWIAYSSDKNTGSIFINSCLFDIIKENKRIISILPVGIEKCAGNFKRGDLVEILTSDNKKIGLGLAKYDAQKLNEYLGQKDKPEFIHYDHLHIF